MGNILTWLDPPKTEEQVPTSSPCSTEYAMFANTRARRDNVEERHRIAIDAHRKYNGVGTGSEYRVFIQGNPKYTPTASGNSSGHGFWPVGMGSMKPHTHLDRIVDQFRYYTDIRLNATKWNDTLPIPVGQSEHAPPLISWQERYRLGAGPQLHFENPVNKSHPGTNGYGNFGTSIYTTQRY